MRTVYLDNAATTPLSGDVAEAMEPFLGSEFGNPSSRHPLGVRASRAVDDARRCVLEALASGRGSAVFTSGGTEANNLAVLGLARAARKRGRHVLIGPTEHPCVRESALALAEEGFEVETGCLRRGREPGLDLEDLERRIRPDTVLVAQMLLQNEFGSVYPVAEIVRILRRRSSAGRLHVDAVQALGKVPVHLDELGAHSLAVSGHKIGGPKGSGCLVLAEGVRPRPLVFGGDQEGGMRSGTENVAGIVGFARAVERAASGQVQAAARYAGLRDALEEGLASHLPGARALTVDGGAGVSPAIVAVLLPGPPAEVWMHHLEARGVMTSAGSACHAKKGAVPPAVLALGLEEDEAKRVLRFSFGAGTSLDDVRLAARELGALKGELAAAL